MLPENKPKITTPLLLKHNRKQKITSLLLVSNNRLNKKKIHEKSRSLSNELMIGKNAYNRRIQAVLIRMGTRHRDGNNHFNVKMRNNRTEKKKQSEETHQ